MAGYKKGTPGYERQQQKYKETMLKKFGNQQAMLDYYHSIASKGGQKGHTGGFAANPELAQKAGAKGGTISSRSNKKKSLEERRENYRSKNGI